MTQDGQTAQTRAKGLSCRMTPCPLCSRSLRPLWAVLILSILFGGGTFFYVVLYPVINQPLVLPPALAHRSLEVSRIKVIKQQTQEPVLFEVELAISPVDQEKGLMEREAVPEGTGMLFPFNPPRLVSFWMKNTHVPLDMIFIGEDNRIIKIAPMTVPYDMTPVASGGAVAAVLEIGGGEAQRLGLSVGDLLQP